MELVLKHRTTLAHTVRLTEFAKMANWGLTIAVHGAGAGAGADADDEVAAIPCSKKTTRTSNFSHRPGRK